MRGVARPATSFLAVTTATSASQAVRGCCVKPTDVTPLHRQRRPQRGRASQRFDRVTTSVVVIDGPTSATQASRRGYTSSGRRRLGSASRQPSVPTTQSNPRRSREVKGRIKGRASSATTPPCAPSPPLPPVHTSCDAATVHTPRVPASPGGGACARDTHASPHLLERAERADLMLPRREASTERESCFRAHASPPLLERAERVDSTPPALR